jgi:hypothetical protein
MPGVPGIQSYTSVAASNTTLFPEGMPPSSVNDGMRQVQADIRSWYTDAEWVNWGDTPSRASATSFKIATDVTSRYAVHRRVKCYDATTIYSTIIASSYSAPDTTITVTNDSGSLTTSLTSVALAIITPTSTSTPSTLGRKGADIASATTTDIGLASGDFVDITGTTTITGLGTAIKAGVERTVRFTGALILTHNATSLILPGTANITTVANDTAKFRSLDASGNWICVSYKRADGTPVGGLNIDSLTALTAPDGADELGIYDASATLNKKITLINLINGQVEDTTPDATADYVMTYDASATNTKKALIKNVNKITFIQTNTSSSSAISEFNALFNSSYNFYYFIFENILPATDAVDFYCQFGTGATPTYTTSGYKYSSTGFSHTGGNTPTGSASAAQIILNGTSNHIDNGAGAGITGQMLIGPANTGANSLSGISDFYSLDSGGSSQVRQCSAFTQPSATFTAIKFYFSSGNIASGKIYMYGLRNS